MDKNHRYGIRTDQEVSGDSVYQDVSTQHQKRMKAIRKGGAIPFLIAAICVLVCFFPQAQEAGLALGFVLSSFGVRQERSYPLLAPIQLATQEPKSKLPGKGIFFFGQDEAGRQIWLDDDRLRQHMLVLGTTGAGKTETLVSYVTNALTWSSGFMYCDGKGDIAVYAKLYALARRFFREDDVLVMNYMSAEQPSDINLADKKISNTSNPLGVGGSSELTQLVVSFMGDSGGKDDMWKGRAQAMFSAVMRGLTFMRDDNRIDMNFGTVRDHLSLAKIYEMAFGEDYDMLPAQTRKALRAYVESLPGFNPADKAEQKGTAADQHGYLQMQFTKIMGSMIDDYGYIFFGKTVEIDVKDIVLNRRILIIMLPALQKSSDEIANIGKIIIGNLKQMMASQLGSVIQGYVSERVLKRAANGDSPFIVVLDEAGYYTVDGMALMTAQARSLGFCIIVSSQDIPAMLRLSDTEAKSVMANTNTKVYMRLEDMEQTMDLAVKSGGKGFTTRIAGYDIDKSSTNGRVTKQEQVKIEETDRIHSLALKGLKTGQIFLVHQEHVIKGRSFYANPQDCFKKEGFGKLYLKVNHFIRIERPQQADLTRQNSMVKLFEMMMDDEVSAKTARDGQEFRARLAERADANDEIASFVKGFVVYLDRNKVFGETQAACAAAANAVRTIGGLDDLIAGPAAPSATRGPVDPMYGMHASSRVADQFPDIVTTDQQSGFHTFQPRPKPGSDPEQMVDPYVGNETGLPDFMPAKVREPSQDVQALIQPRQQPAVKPVRPVTDAPAAPAPAAKLPPHGETRKAARVDMTATHDVVINQTRVEETPDGSNDNDSLQRVFSALSYDPDTTTAEQVDEVMRENLGSRSDPFYEDVAKTEVLDESIARSEIVRVEETVQGEEESGGGQQAEVLIADLLDTIMEE